MAQESVSPIRQARLFYFPGYFTQLEPGGGCLSCECNYYGSLPQTDSLCDTLTGQCQCKQGNSGVTGLNCDKCQEGFFNFNDKDGTYVCQELCQTFHECFLLAMISYVPHTIVSNFHDFVLPCNRY